MKTFYPTVKVKKLADVPMPAYAKPGDAGLDLCATEDVTLYPGEWWMMSSGIAVAIPHGYVGLVVPRSGLGCKGLVIKNTTGVIDSGYRGKIGLTLLNNNPQFVWAAKYQKSSNRFPRIYRWLIKRIGYEPLALVPNENGEVFIHKGDRVAQLLIVPVAEATMVEVDELNETERGDAGFGSTGVRL